MSGGADPPFVQAIQELVDELRLQRQHDLDSWKNSAQEQLLFGLEAALARYRGETEWRKQL